MKLTNHVGRTQGLRVKGLEFAVGSGGRGRETGFVQCIPTTEITSATNFRTHITFLWIARLLALS